MRSKEQRGRQKEREDWNEGQREQTDGKKERKTEEEEGKEGGGQLKAYVCGVKTKKRQQPSMSTSW